MITIQFDKGTFYLDNGEHTITVKIDGTITSYTGRTVKRFPKGFTKTDVYNSICHMEYHSYLYLINKLVFDIHDYNVAKYVERLYNTGVLANINPSEYRNPYMWVDFANRFTFKQGLKVIRDFINDSPDTEFTLYQIMDWYKNIKFMTEPHVATLIQYYNINIISGIHDCYADEWNIISKILLDDSIFDYYCITRSHDYYVLVQLIERIFSYAKKLNTKIPTKNVMHELARMMREWDKIKDQRCNETLTKYNSKSFAYENDKFIVIVPQTIEELIAEGNAQHNCVGEYWTRHYGNDIENGIMSRGVVFIRRKDDISESYITCDFEIGTKYICQYLERYNCNVSDTDALAFKKEYQQYLYTL